ncbi:unnamed protein product, partial [Symbiodinium microadriaticum]
LLDSDLKGQLRGRPKAAEEYVAGSQSKLHNARSQALKASYSVWKEELRADQLNHETMVRGCLAEAGKRRNELLRTLEVLPTILPHLQQSFAKSVDPKPGEEALMWNLPTQGVLTAMKTDYFISCTTNMLAMHPLKGIAVVVFPNKTAVEKKEKPKDEEDEDVKEEQDQDMEDGAAEDDAPAGDEEVATEAAVRALRYDLLKSLSEPKRRLEVKECIFQFEEASVFGSRSCILHGALVTARNSANVFHKSKPFKHGFISGIATWMNQLAQCPAAAATCPRIFDPEEMLARKDMLKPNWEKGLPTNESLSDSQEMRQVSAGTSFVKETIRSLTQQFPSMKRVAVVDALGYDGSVPMAVLEEQASGADWSAVTIADSRIANWIEARVRESCYGLARSGALELCGFPSFDALTSGLKDTAAPSQMDAADFKVTRPLPNGDLALVESFYKKFEDFDEISEDLRKAIQEHDKRYNPQGKRIRCEQPDGDSKEEPAAKRIKLVEHEQPLTSKDIAELQNPSILSVSGTVRFLHEADSGDKIWAEVDEATTFLAGKLLGSFGSGSFMDGKDATKTMAELGKEEDGARLLRFRVDFDSLLILEKKKISSHLADLPYLDKPAPVKTLLKALEDHGEAKVQISHHEVSLAEGVINEKDTLIFVLDSLEKTAKQGRKSKSGKKKEAVPAVSWGRTLDLAKVKQCEALAIAWHVRCDRAAEEGPKHSCRLVPLRPALVLRGLFDVEPGVYQIM